MKVGMRLMRDKHSSQIIKSYSADASAVQRFGLVLKGIFLQLSIYNDTWHGSHFNSKLKELSKKKEDHPKHIKWFQEKFKLFDLLKL